MFSKSKLVCTEMLIPVKEVLQGRYNTGWLLFGKCCFDNVPSTLDAPNMQVSQIQSIFEKHKDHKIKSRA